jgi:hypothetical protein
MGSVGYAFQASFTGEYRLETGGDVATVRIYREAADAAALACGQNQHGPGCPYHRGLSASHAAIIVLSIPFI